MINFFFFKQKTAYEMRISDWSSDVCSSDLEGRRVAKVKLDIGCRERFFKERINVIEDIVCCTVAPELGLLFGEFFVEDAAAAVVLIGLPGVLVLFVLQDRKSTRLNSSH